MLSGETLVGCGLKCRIVGGDNCAIPGQVAEHVVVGCSTTSTADYRSVAADVVPTSTIPVLRFGESRRIDVIVIGVVLLDVL